MINKINVVLFANKTRFSYIVNYATKKSVFAEI